MFCAMANNVKRIDRSHDLEFGIVLGVTSIMFLIKMCFSFCVFGTNDITSWYLYAGLIEKVGTFKIYSVIGLYNHPPLISWILKLIICLEHTTHLSFPYLFRVLPIVADFFSVIVIWALLEKYDAKNKAVICVICALNPINFLISGFHGNTDPIFILFILFSLLLIEENKIVPAGLIYGLSLCIKIVPLILIPMFFFSLRSKQKIVLFFFSSLLIPLITYTPYLIYDYHSVVRNIFSYNSYPAWGLGHLLDSVSKNLNINILVRHISDGILQKYTAGFRVIFFVAQIVLLRGLTKTGKFDLMKLSFLSISLFLILTPGFGVQYLSWLSYFAIAVFPIIGSIYVLLGGITLWRIYLSWGGGLPPYYANSWTSGLWMGDFSLLVLWLLIIIMLIKLMVDHKECS